MDKRTKALKMRQEGKEYLDIAQTLGVSLNNAYKLVSEAKSRERAGYGSYEYVIARIKKEMFDKEKLCGALLPYRNEQDKLSFHSMQKDIVKLSQDLRYFELKKKSKDNLDGFFNARKKLKEWND